MRAKDGRALEDALDEGIAFGWSHGLKYTEMSDEVGAWIAEQEERIKESFRDEILNAICERFEFDQSKEER